jgi:predicted kinase
MLYVFGGLPGTGKSTLALRLARETGAFYLRIDTVEDALGVAGPEGYVVAYRIAVDNLRLGRSVIADCVNPVRATREAWRAVAAECEVPMTEIELVCSDSAEHRRRVEARATGRLRWSDVSRKDYEPWDPPPLVLDTAADGVEASYAALRRLLQPDALPTTSSTEDLESLRKRLK